MTIFPSSFESPTGLDYYQEEKGEADLVNPESLLVEAGKAVDDDGQGKGQAEDADQGAEASDHLAEEGLWAGLVADRGDGHDPPPGREGEGTKGKFYGTREN